MKFFLLNNKKRTRKYKPFEMDGEPEFNWNLYYDVFYSDSYPTVKAFTDIKRVGSICLGSSSSSIIRKWNKPCQCKTIRYPLKLEILYYKLKIAEKKAICKLVLSSDKMFHLSLRFRYLTESEKHKLQTLIFNKYLKQSICLSNYKFVDCQGNVMLIDDGFYLTLHYFLNDSIIVDKIKKALWQTQFHNKNQEDLKLEKLVKVL